MNLLLKKTNEKYTTKLNTYVFVIKT